MKKITLLVAGLLFSGSLALASEQTIFSGRPTNYKPVDYREADPIAFMERGIEFFVFPNGDFDFNTQPVNSRTQNTYYRHDRTYGNATYGAPTYSSAVKIEHDYNGRVRRVGNVFINYDAYGRVKRIGTVYMSYNSFALSQIGNLHLIYNRSRALVDITGYVNAYNRDYSYSYAYNSNSGSYGGSSYGGSTRGDDDDRYYRKPAGKPGQ